MRGAFWLSVAETVRAGASVAAAMPTVANTITEIP
jgi:hypothetical protein